MKQTTFKKISKIGFIGLGTMGKPMALRLIQAGLDVTVYDTQSEPMKFLQQQGAKIAANIQDLAADRDVIITMLDTGEQVRKICLGEHGIYFNASPRTIHLDTSSIDVATTRELHKRAQGAEMASLDAPVFGGVTAAANGQLTFAVGGDELVLERVMPILNILGKRVVYTGEAGNGQASRENLQ